MRKRIWISEIPMINLRRYREVGVIGMGVGIEGWFDVELVHARTGLIKRKLRFRNLITDAGLNRLGGSNENDAVNQRIAYIAVGSSNTPPDVSDTSLGDEIARTASTGGFASQDGTQGSGDSVEYAWHLETRVFGQSSANGNLAELGCFDSSSEGTLWNRQLFRDENGDPTVITKTNEDQLRIRYETRIFPPMDDALDTVDINGTNTNITIRPQGVTGNWGVYKTGVNSDRDMAVYPGSIGGRSGNPSGSRIRSSSRNRSSGDGYIEKEDTWSPALANMQIQSLGDAYAFDNRWQVGFDPAIEKTDAERLVIQVRETFHRYEPAP